jgi:hypothetical protein
VGLLTSNSDDKTFASEAKEGVGILGRRFGRSHHETKSTLDLRDIQGFILRGYRMPMVRHFLLSVATPTEARKLLGRFVSGDETDAPQITTAEDWHVGFAPGPGNNPADVPRHKPDYCLNVAITWPGMIALEIKVRVPTISFKSHQTIKPYQQLRYGSNVPFRHGPIDVVKYSATPFQDNLARPLQKSNLNGLQDELIRHVQEDNKMSSFDFGVQFLNAE